MARSLLWLACSAAATEVLHVAQDDASADFATLVATRDYLRSLPRAAAAGATVVVHPGVYRETLTLGPDDSGSPGRPITWRALDGRGAALSGGVEVPRAAFAAVGPSSPLVRADLYAQGVTRSVLRCGDLRERLTGTSIENRSRRVR